MTNLKQKFNKVVAMAITLTFVVVGSVFAGTNTSGTVNDETWLVPTFQTTDKNLSNNDWSRSVTISPGEKLAFDLHYFFNDSNAGKNVKFLMSNLDGKTYNAGQSITVNGTVSSSNRTNKSGSVSVKFTEKVKLHLYNVSWQKWPCQSVGCETKLPDTYSKVLTTGLNIGTVASDDSHYAGNMIVEFKVEKVEETPTYENCTVNGVTVNHGASRNFFSTTHVAYGDSCSDVDQTRTCNDGNLSGDSSYRYTTCTPDSAPVNPVDSEVFTRTATNISETCATLNGRIEMNDDNREEVYFQYGVRGDVRTVSVKEMTSDGNFSKTVCGLTPDTTYVFAAVSDHSEGRVMTFRTEAETSSSEDGDVDTNSATNIDTDSARLNGDVEDADMDEVWFAFSRTDSTPSCSSNSQRVDARGGTDEGDDFYADVYSLREDTRYYFKACGEDEDGNEVEGLVRTFRTDKEDDGEIGDVRTNSATNIDDDSARLNGEIEDTDMDEVWFAFSETDRTPNCNYSSQKIDARGGTDEGDDFYAYVYGLDEDETYYFRACGEDEDGNEVEGLVRSFKTDGDDNEEIIEARVYTNSATNIQKYSAQLNGYVDINDTENGKVYFVYGTSSSYMNRKTSELRVSGNSTFQAITGLNANTRYYFQAIIKDNDGIVDRGVVRNFRTDESTPAVNPVNGRCGSYNNACVRGKWVNIKDSSTQYKWACNGYNGGRTAVCTLNKGRTNPSKPPVVISKPIEVIVKNETTVTTTKNYEERGLRINKWVGKSRTGTFGVETTAKRGDTVFYKIKVKNTSDEVVNVKVEDFLPEELDDKDGTTADSDRYITWVLAMNPGQTKTFIKELIVDSNVDEGDIIDSAAKVTVDDITEETNEVTIEIVRGNGDGNEDRDRNSASFFGANSDFFPTSIFGWLLVLILAFGVLLLGTKVLTVTAKKD